MINAAGGAVYEIYDKDRRRSSPGRPSRLARLGFCGSGLGDPIVLYDRSGDRWMLSEFSNSGNRLCVYVSQTGDPVTGGWFNYDFTAPSFPDYPKYAVWPDCLLRRRRNEIEPGALRLERSPDAQAGGRHYQRFTAPDLAASVSRPRLRRSRRLGAARRGAELLHAPPRRRGPQRPRATGPGLPRDLGVHVDWAPPPTRRSPARSTSASPSSTRASAA